VVRIVRLRTMDVEGLQMSFAGQKVLDVGCGRWSPHDYRDAHVVGLDLNSEALAGNPSLDERLVGDIMSYPLPESSFDAAVCWDVLEHLPDPRGALLRIGRAIRPGGLVVLGFPNLLSFKGLATKLTPHRFHVWVYKHVFHFPNAGAPGHGPYKTYLRWQMRPRALAHFAQEHGFDVERLLLYSRPPSDLGTPARQLLGLSRRSECQVVLRKRAVTSR
jgi:SAM-dependent methyltransferase